MKQQHHLLAVTITAVGTLVFWTDWFSWGQRLWAAPLVVSCQVCLCHMTYLLMFCICWPQLSLRLALGQLPRRSLRRRRRGGREDSLLLFSSLLFLLSLCKPRPLRPFTRLQRRASRRAARGQQQQYLVRRLHGAPCGQGLYEATASGRQCLQGPRALQRHEGPLRTLPEPLNTCKSSDTAAALPRPFALIGCFCFPTLLSVWLVRSDHMTTRSPAAATGNAPIRFKIHKNLIKL